VDDNAERYRTLIEGGAELHVPALCDVEVASAIRKIVREDLVSADRIGELVEDYLDLPLNRHGHTLLVPRILELRDSFTAYDASYVVLAEFLGARLLTADDRLARAVRNAHEITVQLAG